MLFLYNYLILVIFLEFSLVYIIIFNIIALLVYYIFFFKICIRPKFFQKSNFLFGTSSQTNTVINYNHNYFIKLYYYTCKNITSYYLLKTSTILLYLPTFNLKWKPLFKKSSYFGIYRSTKNQYLNK